MFSRRSCPRSQVETIWRLGVDGEAIRSIRSFRQGDSLPVLGPVCRPVQSTIAGIADASILRPTCDYNVERPNRASRQPPGERLFLRDPIVLQGPGVAAIGTLVNAAAKTGYVQYTRLHRAGGIKKNMGRRCLVHPSIRLGPVLAAVITCTNAAFVCQQRGMSPHLGARKIMC